ncbi:MAG TPA: single-stranded DNA-binding protein [Dehalococcoidia bacterium]|jgi:single-strand DNA-binding protein|nr:single-stranded DNA-binding protein [Dehalococcoidia bacterium]
MAGLNKVMIIGNLGADPEMRYTADGTALTNFRVAASRTYSGADGERKEETEWFSVVTWRKLAEQCSQFLQKGRRVYVEGRLQTRSWDTPEGEKRYRTEVIADRVLFLDRAGEMPLPEHRDAIPTGGDVEPEDIPFE